MEYAIPTAQHNPTPNDPVATSMYYSLGVGCPYKLDSNDLSL